MARNRVALHDADNTTFPNLALMKLSSWHKKRGDYLSWYDSSVRFDLVYSSKVFTFTDNADLLPDNSIKGGTGYKNSLKLPDEVEHIMPDYGLYMSTFSQGFLTRGCPNMCSWCIVPGKEGGIRPNADIEEFLSHKDVVLMDNNVLAHDHGIEQIEKMSRLGIKVDFNQGLDARLIDDGVARRLSKLKWLKPLRLACDSASQMKHIQKAVTLLRYHNCTPRQYFVYLLVKDVDDALERVRFLKGMNLDPFAQPYRDFTTDIEPSKEQKRFARWVNHKAIFKSTTWEDYKYNAKTKRMLVV